MNILCYQILGFRLISLGSKGKVYGFLEGGAVFFFLSELLK